MELTLKSGAKDDKTLSSDLSSVGAHVFVDKFFAERLDEIREKFPEYMAEEEISELNLSAGRASMLKQAMNLIRWVWYQAAFGEGIDRPEFLRAADAASETVQRVKEKLLYSKADDEDVLYICEEFLSQPKKVVLRAFNQRNSTINKSFYVSAPMIPGGMGGAGGGFLDEDTKEMLKENARESARRAAEAKGVKG